MHIPGLACNPSQSFGKGFLAGVDLLGTDRSLPALMGEAQGDRYTESFCKEHLPKPAPGTKTFPQRTGCSPCRGGAGCGGQGWVGELLSLQSINMS